MPRPLSDSWQYFEVLDSADNGKSRKAKCNFCGHEQSAAITRLHQHLLNRCSGIPIELHQELKRKDENSRESEKRITGSDIPASSIPGLSQPTSSVEYDINPPLHTNNLQSSSSNTISQPTSVPTANSSSYYSATHITPRSNPIPVNFQATPQPQSDRSQAALDWQLARALFSANIPFEAVENTYMIEFFKHLQPGYTVPKAQRLKQLLLKEEHWDIIQRDPVNKHLSNTFSPSTIQQQQPLQQQHTNNAAINLMMLSSNSSRPMSSFNPPADVEGSL